MKRLMAAATAALGLAMLAGTQRTNAAAGDDTKEQILAIERARNQAILSGDAAALDRMTSDDYTFITLRGELRTKREIVQGFKSGTFHYESRSISDLNVRVYGDTAVVTGRSNQKGSENGKDYSAITGSHACIRGRAAAGKRWRCRLR